MFCRKCRYTSFDHYETCPKCGYNWEEERKRLNLDWLGTMASHQFASSKQDSGAEHHSLDNETGQALNRTGQGQKTEYASPLEETSSGQNRPSQSAALDQQPLQPPPPPPHPPQSEARNPIPPAGDMNFEEIEYTFEGFSGDSQEQPRNQPATAEPTVQIPDDDWEIVMEDSETAIELEAEDSEQEQSSGSAGAQNNFRDQNQKEFASEDSEDWTALIEEIELETTLDPQTKSGQNS